MLSEIDVLGLSLKTFGILFALAFLAAGAIVQRRLKEIGRSPDEATELTFAALAGGLVGARVYYVIQNWDETSDDLLGALFSASGLVWYGGAIGGAIGVLLWAWRRDFLGLRLLDVCAVPLAVGYALGRVGCQISGDGDYGQPSSLPWAMGYPDGAVSTPPGVEVQPTPVYETLALGLGGWVLWRLRDRFRPGVLFALYLVLAGTERFLIEFIRRNEAVVAGLTGAQLESLALAAAGLVWLAVARPLRHAGRAAVGAS